MPDLPLLKLGIDTFCDKIYVVCLVMIVFYMFIMPYAAHWIFTIGAALSTKNDKSTLLLSFYE